MTSSLIPSISSAGKNHGYSTATETSAAGRSSGGSGSKLKIVPLSPGGGAYQTAHGRPPSALWHRGVIRSSCQKSRDVLRWVCLGFHNSAVPACSLILWILSACLRLLLPGLAPGSNLSELELNPMMGVLKDTGGQQSRFKWMMEGHSPAPSPPDTTLHKNGTLTDGSSNHFFGRILFNFCQAAPPPSCQQSGSKHIGCHLFLFIYLFILNCLFK